MSAPATARQRARTRRRQLGFAGLVVGCVALVEAKASTAPPTHHIHLGGPTNAATTPHSQAVPRPTSTTAVRSVTGQPFDIGYGVVQVRVVLRGSRIIDVIPLQLPSGGRSGDIASYAVPQLRAEVLSAQSPNIDTVSGASYTSDGYARSVQSALDSARQ